MYLLKILVYRHIYLQGNFVIIKDYIIFALIRCVDENGRIVTNFTHLNIKHGFNISDTWLNNVKNHITSDALPDETRDTYSDVDEINQPSTTVFKEISDNKSQ